MPAARSRGGVPQRELAAQRPKLWHHVGLRRLQWKLEQSSGHGQGVRGHGTAMEYALGRDPISDRLLGFKACRHKNN